MNSWREEMIGWKVEEIYLCGDDDRLIFRLSRDDEQILFTLVARGDCCSSSYFNDLIWVSNILGEVITEIEEKSLGARDTWREDECIAYYGFTFKSRLGVFDLVFRNESNGYYGGFIVAFTSNCMDIPASIPAGARKITEDWTA